MVVHCDRWVSKYDPEFESHLTNGSLCCAVEENARVHSLRTDQLIEYASRYLLRGLVTRCFGWKRDIYTALRKCVFCGVSKKSLFIDLQNPLQHSCPTHRTSNNRHRNTDNTHATTTYLLPLLEALLTNYSAMSQCQKPEYASRNLKGTEIPQPA